MVTACSSPFEHDAGICVLWDSPHGSTILQGHPLQKPVVHVITHPNGKEAELLLHCCFGVANDGWTLNHAHCGPSVCQEDDEWHTVVMGLFLAGQVVAEQCRACLNSTVDVSAWEILNKRAFRIFNIFMLYIYFNQNRAGQYFTFCDNSNDQAVEICYLVYIYHPMWIYVHC